MGNPGKEQMPKISGEFKPAPPPGRPAPQPVRPAPAAPPRPAQAGARAPQPVTARPPQPVAARPPQQATARGAPQPVTKPAPMAPRTPQASGARPVTPIPQGAPGLGDRLRAERQAAEKLADQRVAQARGRNGDRPVQPPVNVTPAQKPAPKAPEKPKFSFSPEELAKDKREQVPPEREFPTFSAKSSTASPPPLTPPRPALGGTAGGQAQQPRQPIQAPPVRQPPPKPAAANPPAGAAFQPRFNGPAQPSGGNYRSLDPPPGGAFAPKPKPYADTAFRDDPLANRQPANREYDSYRRGLPQAPQPAYGDDGGPSLGDYRRRQQVPARTRQPAYDEDVNEVFEDEEPQRPPRRRASAQDYNRAYRDYEDGYDAEAPRRRGPWPWLLAILLGGVLITGAMIFYYLNYYKASGPAAGNVPVIEAPEQSSKTAPEPLSGSTLGTQGAIQPDAADKTKKIYDRILGDEEADGNQVVPTQEQPQIVEPTGSNEEQSTAPASDQPSGSGDNANEPLPLPLPPPGEQGALPSNASQQTAAMGTTTTTDQKSVPEPASTNTANTVDTGAPVPGQLQKSTEPAADTQPPQIEQVVSTPEPVPEKPAKPKARTEKKPAKKVVAAVEDVGAGQNNGVAPLVLVPPAQSGNAEAQTPPTIAQPADQAVNPETAQPVEEKSKSFFGLGSTKRKLTGKAAERANAQGAAGNWANSPDPNAAVSDAGGLPAPTPEQQVASVAPEPIPLPAPEPTPQQAKPAAGGFVAQLASFRSEAEAMAEFDRLRAKHGDVLGGLSPRVVKANIGGSPRYRLGVGPLASRSAALKICNSLISAGERDCLVRGN